MPVWNHARHLPDALRSIERQTFRDFELVIVLDGPGDGSREVVSSMDFSFISSVSVHEKNEGTAISLNDGFAKCSGYYWTWVSDDNVMDDRWLEVLVSIMDANPDWMCVHSSYVRQTGSFVDGAWEPESEVMYNATSAPLIDSENSHIGCSFLYRRALHEKVGEHRGRISHDYDWWLRAEEIQPSHPLSSPLCTYRVHPDRVGDLRRHEYDAPRWRREAMKRRLAHG